MMKKIFLALVVTLFIMNAFAQEAKETIKPALLVIDVQNAYIDMMDQSSIDSPVEMINAYIRVFKAQNLPIIYVYHQDKKWGPASDSKGFQFIDKIPVPEDAKKMTKHYGNAFNKTDLDKILKELDCNTLFLCGLSATGCVMATTIGAMDNDYNVFWIKDATMSPDKEKTEMIEDVFNAVGYQAVKAIIE